MPYYSQHKDDVEYDEFNLLGTRASLGCIRLAVGESQPLQFYLDQAVRLLGEELQKRGAG